MAKEFFPQMLYEWKNKDIFNILLSTIKPVSYISLVYKKEDRSTCSLDL